MQASDDECDLKEFLVSEDEDEEHDFVVVTNNKASLRHCNNVVLGNELKGPIQVEKMIVLQKNEQCENTKKDTLPNVEFSVGSIVEMFNTEGLKLLEESFKINPRPDKVERDRLAQLTGTRRKMVRKWFEIQRTRHKRNLSMKEPIKAMTTLWSYWSKKFKRKVKFLSVLLLVYILCSMYCLCYQAWYQVLATSVFAFLLMNFILSLLYN